MTRKVVAIAVVQAIVLSWLANVLPTWQDEEFTLATTAHGVAYAIHRALTYELQAPLYFAVLAALRRFDTSVFFAREFSVAAQVVTTLVSATIARRLWPSRDPWVFCALVASNPFSIFTAMEIRTYALSLLETAIFFTCFLEGFFCGDDLRARAALVVCAIVGLYTQYFIAFEMIGLFFALAVAGRFAALRDYTLCCIAAAIAFVPLGLYVRGQASDTLGTERSTGEGFGGMLLHPVNLILARNYSAPKDQWQTIFWTIPRLAFIAVVIAGRPRLTRNQIALLTIFFVVDLIYVVLSDGLKLNLLIPRHFIALFIPEAMLAYVLVAAFKSKHAGRLAVASAAIFAFSNAVTFAQTYASGAKEGDARRVGAYLATEAKAGDAIAVYPGDAVAPMERYYRGTLPMEGFPIPQSPTNYDVDAAIVRSMAAASRAFDRLPKARHIWLVEVLECGDNNIHGCKFAEAVMNERYRVVSRRGFYQTTVFELEPKGS